MPTDSRFVAAYNQ